MSCISGENGNKAASTGIMLPFAKYRVGDPANLAGRVWDEVQLHGIPLNVCEQTLFQPESPQFVYFVGKGKFKTVFITRNGKERPLLLYEPGAMFNLANGILGERLVGNYYAMEGGTLWKIPVEKIMGDPICCPHLANAALRVLAAIVATYYAGLTYLVVDNFRVSFCRYLLLAMSNNNNEHVFSIGMTQEECAAMLGVHRATLARIAGELKKEGVIDCFTSERTVILDKQKLIEFAQY